MKYMGSKNRIAKYILPIMLAERKPNQWWVEPFVGGGNMIDKVDGCRIGSDLDMLVIDGLNAIKNKVDRLPKDNSEFTEKDYKEATDGYSAYALSYGGKRWGGWCRDGAGKRDYVSESYRNAVRQSPKLQGVNLVYTSYDKLELPPNSLIYCDPPYREATGYAKTSFDHYSFYEWCIEKHTEGHTVFISEYSMPPVFECVWEKEIVSSLTKNTGAKRGVEKLFTLRNETKYKKELKEEDGEE